MALVPEVLKLMQQMLSIFRRHLFCLKFCKRRFTLSSSPLILATKGTTLAAEKLHAIQAWPVILIIGPQTRKFPGTVKYYRMFIDPEFAVVVCLVVDIAVKGSTSHWTELRTLIVRRLTHPLIDYTALNTSGATNCFQVYTTASSGYSVGAVHVQAHRPFGFPCQATHPVWQEYSSYDQNFPK